MFSKKSPEEKKAALKEKMVVQAEKIITKTVKATNDLQKHLDTDYLKQLDKLAKDKLKEQKRQLKKAKITEVYTKNQRRDDLRALDSQYNAVNQHIKVRNNKINNKKNNMSTSDAIEETIKFYAESKIAIDQNVPSLASIKTKQDAVARLVKKLDMVPDSGLPTFTKNKTKEDYLSTQKPAKNYEKFMTALEENKGTFNVRRNSGGLSAIFWAGVNRVKKFFNKDAQLSEKGITSANYAKDVHGLFGQHKRIVDQYRKKIGKEPSKYPTFNKK